MMFCSKCGTKNPDNANFCQGCGSPLIKPSQEKPQENFYQSPPPNVNPNPTINPNPTVNQGTAELKPESPLEALRRVASSGLFRFTAFAFCSLILSNILALVDASFTWGIFTEIFNNVDPSVVDEMSGYLGSFSIVTAIFSQLPNVLIAIGLWMTYATAASKKGKPFSTAGLTIIKVIYTVELVILCVLLALMMIIMLIATLSTDNADDAMIVFLGVLFIDVFFGALIFWIAMIIKSLNTAKTAATEEHGKHLGKNASAFIGVICYFMGAINIVAAVANLISLSIVAFCNCAIAVAVQICFAVLIFRFRGEMKRLK